MNEFLFIFHCLFSTLLVIFAAKHSKEALIALIVSLSLLANLFVIKQMHLFFWDVTESEVYAIASFLGFSLLQEIHGKETAQLAIKLSLLNLILFCAFSQIHLSYAPTPLDQATPHFAALLQTTPRIMSSSLICYFISAKLDLLLQRSLKNKAPTLSFERRTLISLLLSQAVDTSLFTFLALYGIVASPLDVITVSLLIKALAICIATPLLSTFKKFLKLAAPT